MLKKINILNLRNLKKVETDLNPHFNFFWGNNGSGKTSFLEGIHVLGTGRSFRSAHPEQVISFSEESCVLSGMVFDTKTEILTRIGFERFRHASCKVRISDKDFSSISELARILPVQIIHTPTLTLLEAEPNSRRQFLDWAMFHVEHAFYPLWQRYKRALQQRNGVLKSIKEGKCSHLSHLQVWDKELVETGEGIDVLRQSVLKSWESFFSEVVFDFLGLADLSVHYNRGWPKENNLQKTLESSLERDRFLGYTSKGPHRADLEFFIGDRPVKTVLSRGQSKLFVCALLIAREKLLQAKTGAYSVFLIDDLSAELDKISSMRLLNALKALKGQVLITTIERYWIEGLNLEKEYRMFHVEQGQVKVE